VSWLGLAALYGTITALLRRDWWVVPLLAWFLATVYWLWRQVPLFPHHLVALIPPLIALAVCGNAPDANSPPIRPQRSFRHAATYATVGLAVLVLIDVIASAQTDSAYFQYLNSSSANRQVRTLAHVAGDVRSAVSNNQQVVSDEQFITGLAGRDSPPELVDTSAVANSYRLPDRDTAGTGECPTRGTRGAVLRR
jgi:hypothetical protein